MFLQWTDWLVVYGFPFGFWLSKWYLIFTIGLKQWINIFYWLHCNNWCVSLVNQVLHMDRNDYYGGESTSLNLVQVVFLLCHLIFIEVCNFILPFYLLEFNSLFTALVILIYSSGRGSGEVISLQQIWALVGIIMWTWSLRCVFTVFCLLSLL
jgi:hypothetical protein